MEARAEQLCSMVDNIIVDWKQRGSGTNAWQTAGISAAAGISSHNANRTAYSARMASSPLLPGVSDDAVPEEGCGACRHARIRLAVATSWQDGDWDMLSMIDIAFSIK